MKHSSLMEIRNSKQEKAIFNKINRFSVFIPCRIFSSCIRLFNRFKLFGDKSSLTSRIVYSPGHEFSTQTNRHLPSLKQTSICVRTQLLNKYIQKL
jgi:hypothetical protein